MEGERFKIIELKDKKFKIAKLDARKGSFILFKVMGIISPLFEKLNTTDLKEIEKGDLTKINITEAISQLTNLSEQDFSYIQDNCLKVCYEILPAGETPVLTENGTYGVIGIEDDMATILGLTVHALIFNVSGFFQEGLSNLIPNFKG